MSGLCIFFESRQKPVKILFHNAGIGLGLGHAMHLTMRGAKIEMKQELMRGTGFYVRIIAPMLFLAAMIETFVTPVILFKFAS